MIRKTFTTKPEAIKYQEDVISQGDIAVLGSLGDKFRVYVYTKEAFEQIQHFRECTVADARRSLYRTAWEEKDAVDNALALQKMMADGSLYNDYEAMIQAARILESIRELEKSKDVLTFIDDPSDYDEKMKQFIEETLEEYDYEAKEETAKV